MKKLCKALCLSLVITLMLTGAAMAESTANATVECDRMINVTAPFSGVLGAFDWKTGSDVKMGQALFTLDTIKLYAPVAGTLGAVYAQGGEDAEGAMQLYGALAAIEPSNPLRVSASIQGASDKIENRFIHVGETVYFKNTEDKVIDGEGRVVYIDGMGYIVEVTRGDYKQNTRVKLYRDSAYASDSCIGTGTISRAANVLVQGTGRVLQCHCQAGQTVAKGQLLFEVVTGNPDPSVDSATVSAPANGVLGAPQVVAGQQVYKGQVLTTIYDMQSLCVVAQVDEMDLGSLTVGGSVRLCFDRYENESMDGTVMLIQKLGVPKQNATYYQVRISVSTQKELLPGMNATVYLPERQ